MHTDAAFIVGHSHHDKAQPCQDYAVAGVAHGDGWAVVSDGCSSRGRTDLGSRLWAHAAKRLLESDKALASVQSLEAFAGALEAPERPGPLALTTADLLATLLVAHVHANRLRVLAFGDGCVVLRHRDGRVHAIELSYENNGPRYLAYRLDAGLDESWAHQMAGSERTARHWYFDASGNLETFSDETVPAPQGRGWFFEFDLEVENLDLVVIASDGAVSLDSRAPNEWFVPLAAVKSRVGQFMQRRLSALVRGWQRQGNRGPSDDLALASIWLQEEKTHV